MAGGKRGRPRRWDDFSDARMWARVQFLVEHDGLTVTAATERIAHRGWWTLRGGRLWLSAPAPAGSELEKIQSKVPAGTSQTDDVSEVFRQRFYIAERRRGVDEAFASDCDFWLRFEHEYAASGDAFAAFKRATLDT